MTPFGKTLYLDNDTRVVGGLGDLFRLLERYDLAAAHRIRDPERVLAAAGTDVPASFPEFNGGVLLYRTTPQVLAFFETWKVLYRQIGSTADQIGLRQALLSSDLHVAVLPSRYNTRRYTWLEHWLSQRARPVILHTNQFHPGKQGGPMKRRLRWLTGPVE